MGPLHRAAPDRGKAPCNEGEVHPLNVRRVWANVSLPSFDLSQSEQQCDQNEKPLITVFELVWVHTA